MMRKLVFRAADILERHVAIRFIISGGTSAAVDLFLLFLLNSVLGVHYLASAVLAFIGAFGVSFTLHKFWTFRSHGEKAHRQAALYLLASLFGLFLNTILMYLFVQHVFTHVIPSMRMNVMASQIVVGGIVAFVSFFISHRFVFKYKRQGMVEIDIQDLR
jgi:putative flippase GtrA